MRPKYYISKIGVKNVMQVVELEEMEREMRMSRKYSHPLPAGYHAVWEEARNKLEEFSHIVGGLAW
jgi:hypothetical protein